MRRSVLFLALLVLAASGCATVPRDTPSLAGEWAPVSAELGGSEFPVANFGGATLHLTGDAYEFAGDKGTYTVVPSPSPAQMDIKGQDGPNAGRTIPAIYVLAGDQLTVCYQLGPGDRPAELASPKGSRILLVHYKRVQLADAPSGTTTH